MTVPPKGLSKPFCRWVSSSWLPRRKHAECGYGSDDPTGYEVPNAELHEQAVLEAHEEARLAGIALTTGPPPQLLINARRLVATRADHVKSAKRGNPVCYHETRRCCLCDLPEGSVEQLWDCR